MKKIVCFLCVVFCSVLFLSSCGTKKEIKSIVVDGVKYNSFYIYSFENANIIDDYKYSEYHAKHRLYFFHLQLL